MTREYVDVYVALDEREKGPEVPMEQPLRLLGRNERIHPCVTDLREKFPEILRWTPLQRGTRSWRLELSIYPGYLSVQLLTTS